MSASLHANNAAAKEKNDERVTGRTTCLADERVPRRAGDVGGFGSSGVQFAIDNGAHRRRHPGAQGITRPGSASRRVVGDRRGFGNSGGGSNFRSMTSATWKTVGCKFGDSALNI